MYLAKRIKPKTLNIGKTPKMIPDGYTEVYFWGVPGSGKTTAIAGILNQIESFGYFDAQTSTGNEYMIQLRSIFKNLPVAVLPGPTPTEVTQCMTFHIGNDVKTDKVHPVAMIEISGEVFNCFYDYKNKKEITGFHKTTFENLLKFLKGKNRKIHFFVIDLTNPTFTPKGTEIELEQSEFLSVAADYFAKESGKIFKKYTEAIYILVTKSDLVPFNPNVNRTTLIEKRLEKEYTNIVNILENRCIRYNINGRKINFLPFSIGEVYFNDFCIFDKDSSKDIVRIIKNRIDAVHSEPSIVKKIMDWLQI